MIPKRLTYGDTIGVVSPSHVAERERYWPMLEGLRKLGFHVKEGKIFTGIPMDTWLRSRSGPTTSTPWCRTIRCG